MTADEVAAALRRRHPDLRGEWLVYRECWRIDLFAMRCWESGIGHRRIAYEIKCSRSDFQAEMRRPQKRAEALAVSHQFYFACPAGLLRPSEMPPEAGLVWVHPDGGKVMRVAPVREPRPFSDREVVYLARFPLYRDGIVETYDELARLRADERFRQRQRLRLDGSRGERVLAPASSSAS